MQVAGIAALIGETVELEEDKSKVASESHGLPGLPLLTLVRYLADQRNINIDTQMIEALNAELQLIAAAKTNLEQVNTTTVAVGEQITAFTAIWNAVNADITKAVGYLDDSINQTVSSFILLPSTPMN
jgi:hypothetical protein